MARYKVTYFDHNLDNIFTEDKDFEGSPEEIATEFRLKRDILGRLETETGEVVYDDMTYVRWYYRRADDWDSN